MIDPSERPSEPGALSKEPALLARTRARRHAIKSAGTGRKLDGPRRGSLGSDSRQSYGYGNKAPRTFVANLPERLAQPTRIAGWLYRYRPLAKTAFLILKDCTGTVQCVAAPDKVNYLSLKLDDVI